MHLSNSGSGGFSFDSAMLFATAMPTFDGDSSDAIIQFPLGFPWADDGVMPLSCDDDDDSGGDDDDDDDDDGGGCPPPPPPPGDDDDDDDDDDGGGGGYYGGDE